MWMMELTLSLCKGDGRGWLGQTARRFASRSQREISFGKTHVDTQILVSGKLRGINFPRCKSSERLQTARRRVRTRLLLLVADVVEAGQLQQVHIAYLHTWSPFHAGVRRLTYIQ